MGNGMQSLYGNSAKLLQHKYGIRLPNPGPFNTPALEMHPAAPTQDPLRRTEPAIITAHTGPGVIAGGRATGGGAVGGVVVVVVVGGVVWEKLGADITKSNVATTPNRVSLENLILNPPKT